MRNIKSILFENKTLKQTVLKNTFWMTFGNLVSRLIRAILIIYAARILGVAGYGIFSYALSIAGFFAIFADIGLTPLLTRESARKPELRIQYLSTALFIKFIFIAISSLIILFVAPFIAKLEGATELFRIIIFLFAFDTLRDFLFGFTRSIERMEIEAGINILTNASILLLGGIALLFFPSNETLIIGYTIGSGIGLLALVWVLREYLKNIWRSFKRTLIKPILTEAWPFALVGLLGTIMLNTDMIMLGWLKGAEDVGFYSAAQKIILLTYLLPGFLVVSLFPTFSRLAMKDNERFRSIFEKGIRAAMLAAFPSVVGGVLLAPGIISFIYGMAYLPATPAFTILLFTFFLTFPGMFIGNAIFAYNRQRMFMVYVGFGALGNVILNYLLIPPYGIIGSAIATTISQLLANGFTWQALKRINNFKTLIHLPKTIAATLVMGIFVFGLSALHLHVALIIPISGIIYLFTLFLLREPLLEYLNPLLILRRQKTGIDESI